MLIGVKRYLTLFVRYLTTDTGKIPYLQHINVTGRGEVVNCILPSQATCESGIYHLTAEGAAMPKNRLVRRVDLYTQINTLDGWLGWNYT